jgi:hypothetical protein
MKTDQAKAIADSALQQLADSLQSGNSEQLTRYLAAAAQFHRYSFSNVMMIVTQRPDATHVAGFHAWLKLKRFVKKGEKGIAIIAPMIFRKEAEPNEKEKPVLRFRVVYVFDIAQTDGEPLPEFSAISGDPAHHLAELEAYIIRCGITIAEGDVPGSALGVSRGGTIGIASGLSPAQRFGVLAHELAHEKLHRKSDRPASKLVCETEAEAVAFVVCHAIGLDAQAASADYIRLYQGDAKTLAASLDRIQRTAAEIIAAVLGEENREQSDASVPATADMAA